MSAGHPTAGPPPGRPGVPLTPRLAALRHRDFRLYWLGQLVSIIGSQMQVTAIHWHVYQLMRGQEWVMNVFGHPVRLSAEALGLGGIGLANVLPVLGFAMLGGLVADSRNRHRVLVTTQSILALCAAGLAVATLTHHDSVWIVYAFSAAAAATSAFNNPAQQSLVPALIPPADLTNAVSLNTLNWQLGTVIGPALTGLIIAAFGAGAIGASGPAGQLPSVGLGIVYLVNAISFIAVISALLAMRYRPAPVASPPGVTWPALAEGLRFVRRDPLIWSTMWLDFWATFFASARTMLPIIADRILDVGVQGYGWLAAAQPVGAVLAGAFLSLKRDLGGQGRLLVASVLVYGVATAVFGVSPWYALSLFSFAVTGAADTVSTVIRATLRQLRTPDDLRGRMVGVNMMFFMGGPQLGELEAGIVGALFGVPFAVVSGGVATVLLSLVVARRVPDLLRYDRHPAATTEPRAAA